MALSKQSQIDRKLGQSNLYYLCKEILGYKDMVPHVHGDLCNFFTNPLYGRFRQGTVPRSWFKSWTVTVGGAIWLTLPDEDFLYKTVYPFKGPNARILIASNISDNAEKFVDKIRREWEDNDRLCSAFPEIVPEFNKARWSNSCAELKRSIKATEGTYTSIGAGGGVVSQHFDMIIEDDLIYAKKDDFSGQELMPSQEDIDKAIGWHKLTASLFVHPKQSCLWNVGTRWAPHDLVDYIRTNESKLFSFFEIAVTRKESPEKEPVWPIPDNSWCNWPERFDKEALEQIRSTQGPKIFETQYLNRPRAGEDVTFDTSYVHKHESIDEYPKNLKYFTFVDLAGWGDKKRLANNVVLTGARDEFNHLWVARLDAGRFNPTEVINKFKEHQAQFNSKVMIEEFQYQTAIRHFAKKGMELDGQLYSIESIKHDQKKNAKDLRIQALEPLVRQGMLHVLYGMTGLMQELEDYPYSSTVDRIDCLGYLFKHAVRSTTPEFVDKQGFFMVTREMLEKECKDMAKSAESSRYPFDFQLGKDNKEMVFNF